MVFSREVLTQYHSNFLVSAKNCLFLGYFTIVSDSQSLDRYDSSISAP